MRAGVAAVWRDGEGAVAGVGVGRCVDGTAGVAEQCAGHAGESRSTRRCEQLQTRLGGGEDEHGSGRVDEDGRRLSTASLSSSSPTTASNAHSKPSTPLARDSGAVSTTSSPAQLNSPLIRQLGSSQHLPQSGSSSAVSSSSSSSVSSQSAGALPSSSFASDEAFNQMESELLGGDDVFDELSPHPGGVGRVDPLKSFSNTRTVSFADFDLRTVIKATQAISREIRLSKLLSTLLDILLRSCGAERAILFTNRRARDEAGRSGRRSSMDETSRPNKSRRARAEDQQQWQIEALSTALNSVTYVTYVRDDDDIKVDEDDDDTDDDKPAERSADKVEQAALETTVDHHRSDHSGHEHQPASVSNHSHQLRAALQEATHAGRRK